MSLLTVLKYFVERRSSLSVWFVLFCTISGESVRNFRLVPLYADLKPTDLSLTSDSVDDVIECARLCRHVTTCFGFFYDDIDRLCLVYDVNFNTLTFQNQYGVKAYEFLTGVPVDCYDVMMYGGLSNGIYTIVPRDGGAPINVSCENDSINEGWLVIQRRTDGSVDFFRPWNDYRDGFGDLNNEFWLGNTNIHRISSQGSYDMRVDLEDFDGSTRYALYNNFSLASELDNFRINVGDYFGTAGNGLSYQKERNFSTFDRDLDKSSVNCASVCKGAWWYTSCHISNLNGLYLRGDHSPYANGMSWTPWKGPYYSLKKSAMKIRPSPRMA